MAKQPLRNGFSRIRPIFYMKKSDNRLEQSQVSNFRSTDRALSDVVTVLLLIGVAVIAVGLIAVFVFDVVPTGQDSVQASLDFNQTGENNEIVTVFHNGGDQLPDNVEVELTGDGEVESHDLDGLSSGQEGEITISSNAEAGDRLSVVVGGSIVGSYDLVEDVTA